MRNIKLIIEYDGTNYSGWQRQSNSLTVQEVIERALYKLTGKECILIASGRTDAGVHALAQVANFTIGSSSIPSAKFSYALNSLLPHDIVIKRSEEVSPNFHSRYSAKAKKYKYLIYNSEHPSALLRNRAYHISQPLNLDNMIKASEYFHGTHDFAGFMSSGSSVKSTVRTIKSISIAPKSDGLELEVSADGFLYNMVRIIAGTLISVGMGKIFPHSVKDIIRSCDRKQAGKTAPPQGLYLVEVYY